MAASFGRVVHMITFCIVRQLLFQFLRRLFVCLVVLWRVTYYSLCAFSFVLVVFWMLVSVFARSLSGVLRCLFISHNTVGTVRAS